MTVLNVIVVGLLRSHALRRQQITFVYVALQCVGSNPTSPYFWWGSSSVVRAPDLHSGGLQNLTRH